jgi:hypothetical protein
MIDTQDYKALANDAAGNWQRFDSFAWFERPDDAELYTIVYTTHRDSSALDRANAKVIADELARFVTRGTVIPQTHSHWAVGHVEGFAIKVLDKRGRVTKAFKTWCDLQARLEDYPVLDEDLLSEIEQEEIEDCWGNWMAHDFQRALEAAFEVDLDAGIGITTEQLRELFDDACNASSTYPEYNGAEVVVNLERIVDAVTYSAIKPYFPRLIVRIFRDGFPLVDGYSIAGDAVCLTPLYEPEFEVCMEAMEAGAEFVNLNGILTWEVC